MEYHGYMDHGGGGFLEWFLLLLLIAIVVAAAVALAIRLMNGHAPRPVATPGSGAVDPLEVVRLRYARGELDREQFLQVTEDLLGRPHGAG